MDREMQRREMRILAASPDYVVGSVHALTEGGSLLIASASGSQLGPLASGAGQVILVIGAQKIVRDVAAGMRRIYEYCYPLEDARARQAYGVPSGVNNSLVINKVMTPGRSPRSSSRSASASELPPIEVSGRHLIPANHRILALPLHSVGRQDDHVAAPASLYRIRIKGRLG